MDVIALASLAVAIIGAAFGIAIIIRKQQLVQARLHLHVGWSRLTWIARNPKLSKLAAKGSLRTLIIGTDSTLCHEALAVCPILLENATRVPITDLRLQLEYPADYLIDGAVIVDHTREIAAVLEPLQGPKERTTFRLTERAWVSFEIPILRPGEKAIIPEVLHLKPLNTLALPEDSPNRSLIHRLTQRFANIQEFLTVIPIHVHVYSSNCSPISADVFLVWLHATSMEQLLECSKRWAETLWNGKHPTPGWYFVPRIPWNRWSRVAHQALGVFHQDQQAELSFLSTPIPESFQPQAAIEAALEAEGAVIAFHMPPWGIMGESYDVQSLIGSPLRRRKDR